MNFAPQIANIYPFCGKSLVLPPGYAAGYPGCGEKSPELGLRRNAPGAPFPWAGFGRNFESA
jgi:hypothetical protein